MNDLPDLSGPGYVPQDGEADSMVILAHGYGANGDDLIGLAAQWVEILPRTIFIAPNAPEPCAMAPGMYQWFGFSGPPGAANEGERSAGVRRAAPVLERFIDQELAHFGIDPGRLALVGFSQGTMMALQVALRRETPPACVVGYSGSLRDEASLEQEIASRPPVLLVHGDSDPMVSVKSMYEAERKLSALGVPVETHVSEGLGHGIDLDGVRLGGAFLRAALGG